MRKDMAKSFNTNAVYISYARNPRPEEKHPEWAGIADIIEPLAQAVRDAGITCYTDTADIQNGDSISEFEQAIGRAKCVILVFSARYFTRPHCMYEFKQILNGVSSGKIKKLILIKAGACNFDDLNFVADLHGEWGRLAWKYEMQPKKAIMEYAKKFNYYKDDIKNLPDFFSSNNYDRAENLDMSRLIRQIKPLFDTPQPHTSSFVKDSNVKQQESTTPTSTSKFNDKYVLYAALAVMFGIIIWLINRTPEQKSEPPSEPDNTTSTLVSDISTDKNDTTKQQPSVEGKKNTHAYVDLGLPSGTLWATTNVGANNPWEYGDYFAWGETSTKSNYDWSTLKYCMDNSGDKFSKYNTTQSKYGNVDNKTTLERSDDAATANWGSDWCMPTQAQFRELIDKCKWTWTTKNGKKGYEVKGPNDNTIFLPAAGCRYGSSLLYVGSDGRYWSSSLYGSDRAWRLYFDSDDRYSYHYNRDRGFSVRAVWCR